MALTMECPLAIPLLIGLWMEADDNGIFEWKPLTLKARILPAAQCDIAALLLELECRKFIKRYAVGGREYGAIRNFKLFQRPKSPKFLYPTTPTILDYVQPSGEVEEIPQNGEIDGAEVEPIPQNKEMSPQREEEGGRRLDEGGNKQETPPARDDSAAAIEAWNVLARERGLPEVQRITDPRRAKLRKRLAECGGLEGWDSALAKIRGSPGLCGSNERGWVIDFDTLMQESTFTKLMEGKYDGWGTGKGSKPSGLDNGFAKLAVGAGGQG